ncbi:outer membrane beta-barrel protein [Flavobacterium sp.]|uniref:outer membrane beta-barrel protein n=1 Tax=Flavobacterium sp. TaxID=239 RepID=UPI00286E6FED|nr:outer membrane beta-barrel protein [Flavobacterium sp.]
MKKLLITTVTLIGIQFANAQEENTPEKNNFKRFYINAGSNIINSDSDFNLNNGYLGLEYKFKDESSIGLNLKYSNLTDENEPTRTIGNPKLFGFQFQFNHDWSEKLGLDTTKFDMYTGLGLGLNFYDSKQIVYNGYLYGGSETKLSLGGQLGMRYFITKRIGINTELGLQNDQISLKTGLTFRL